jgi:hypothetical protein
VEPEGLQFRGLPSFLPTSLPANDVIMVGRVIMLYLGSACMVILRM